MGSNWAAARSSGGHRPSRSPSASTWSATPGWRSTTALPRSWPRWSPPGRLRRMSWKDCGLNLEVWRTQLRQVHNVVEGRAAGRTEPPRHARREARAALGAVPAMAPPPDDAHLLHHRRRLAHGRHRALSPSCRSTTDGCDVVDVEAPRLGIDATLEGLEVGAVIDRIAESSGQEAWLVAPRGPRGRCGALVRHLPRGAGSWHRRTVVRTVTVPSAEGALVLLVAVDDFYAPTPVSGATPVDAPGRRS